MSVIIIRPSVAAAKAKKFGKKEKRIFSCA